MGEYYAWSAVLLAAAVVAGMAMLAARIVYSVRHTLETAVGTMGDREREQQVVDATIDTIRRNRLYALCAVLIAFMHVTYFTALAIAIHDRSAGPDLQANRPAPDVRPATRLVETTFRCPVPDANDISIIYFPAAEASLDCTSEVFRRIDLSRIDEIFCRASSEDRAMFLSRMRRSCRGAEEAEPNIRTLLRLAALFEQLAAHDEGRLLVEVRGHADITTVSPNFRVYVSNAELANRRAEATEAILRNIARLATTRHGSLEIEWRTYGVSSEPSFLDGRRHIANIEYRSTEIQVVRLGERTLRQEVRALASHDQLDLLDYLYFTIYTITTTGYGDIIPLSAFARFVVSLANLYELFFVAIIFNIVAAAGRD